MSENAVHDWKMIDLRGVDWTESSNRTPSGIRESMLHFNEATM